MRPRAILTWERIRFLPWLDVRAEPFCHGERIWFLPCHMWVLSHSDVTVGLVPTWSDISVECHCWNGGTWLVTRKTHSRTKGHSDMTVGLVRTWLYIRDIAIFWMELPGEVPGKLILGLRAILIWLWDVLSHDHIWVHFHSDVIEGCVPTWLDVRANPFYHG